MKPVIDATALRKNLATNVRRLRKHKGLSQTELAELCGVSYVQINRIENGHHSPSAEMLYTLADALEVGTDALRQVSLQLA